MATGRHYKRGSDLRLSCSLCMESYRGRTPKLLPCFHTFCLPCLENIVVTATSKKSASHADDSPVKDTKKTCEENKQNIEVTEKETNPEEKKEDKIDDSTEEEEDKEVIFQCPTCRVSIPVPAGGVSQFQTNFYVDCDDEPDASLDLPVECDTCEDGSRETATHECGDCRHRMCSRCSRMHPIHAQGHRVRPLDAGAVGKATSKVVKTRECPSHAGQSLCFHCRQCDVSVCLHCKLTSHEGHTTEDFMAAVTRAKGEVNRLIVTANQQIQVLENVLGRLERDTLELSRQKQEMTSNVTSKYEALMTWATRACDEALEEMECVQRAALTEMEAERIVARDTKQLLSRLVTRAASSCHTDADADIVLHKSELQAALLDDDALTRYRQRGNKEGHVTFFTYRSDDKAVQLDQVRDFMGRQEGQDQDKQDKMAVMSMRELSENALTTIQSLEDLRMNMRTMTRNPFIFDVVDYNEGGGYDTATGVFTAPVTGTYIFMANLYDQTYGSGYGYISLSIDSKNINFMNISNCVGMIHDIVSLKTGQKVSLVPDSQFTLYSNDLYTFYSGALLRANPSAE
ncbi:tripartite motif-containing protein 45-like isoform X2 [Pomacea canaliculata]|uniref:tripartite motif-containing protein 45-like isoform X2 n=1 Tax=Pomacea canaliculata TaxID=400727 RepID=UPI000D7333C4|nr:tripartite motif-containing protein 45-like isoform X2 [Pomacea canaliculata]